MRKNICKNICKFKNTYVSLQRQTIRISINIKKQITMATKLQQWSNSLKRKARKELKKVKYVKNVIFYPDGRAQKIGFAHDYSFWAW